MRTRSDLILQLISEYTILKDGRKNIYGMSELTTLKEIIGVYNMAFEHILKYKPIKTEEIEKYMVLK